MGKETSIHDDEDYNYNTYNQANLTNPVNSGTTGNNQANLTNPVNSGTTGNNQANLTNPVNSGSTGNNQANGTNPVINENKFDWLKWILILLGLLLLLLLLGFLYNHFNKGNDGNNSQSPRSEINPIGAPYGEDNKKGVISGNDIENYKQNPKNQITPIGDVNGDGKEDFTVISNEEINNSIIKNIIIPFPKNPEIDCIDSKFSEKWYKNNIFYTPKVDELIKNVGTKNSVTVAVIDSGVSKHKDLLSNINEKDFEGNNDSLGHGTHVAGLIAAINPNVRIIPIKVSEGEKIDKVDLINGIKKAIDLNPDIINLSVGGEYDKVERKLIEEAIAKGIIIIASAGNETKDVISYFPASYSGVLAIGSIGTENKLSPFSNFGKTIDLVTPGECITSTFLNNGYQKMSGTSMSSPILTGIISLYIQIHNDKREYVIDKLYETSYEVDGYKIPNLEKLLGVSSEISNNCNDNENWKQKYLDLLDTKKKEIIDKLNSYNLETKDFLTGLDKNNVKDKFKKLDDKQKELDIINSIKVLDELYNTNDIENNFKKLFGNENEQNNDNIVSIKENQLSESIGIDVNTNDFSLLIKKGTKLPASGEGFYITRKEYQRTMFFDIYQGNSSISSKNNKLGRLTLEGLIPMKEKDKKRVKVNLFIDKLGKMSVTATDLLNKNNKINAKIEKEATFITIDLSNLKEVNKLIIESNNISNKLISELSK